MAEYSPKSIESFFKCALDYMCIADISGRFLDFSNSWQTKFGWSKEELLARPFIEFIHPEDQKSTLAAVEKIRSGQTVVDFENRYRSKTGHYYWLQWRANRSDEDDNLVYAIAREITDAKSKQLRTYNDIRLLEMAERTARVGHWHLETETGLLKWSNEVFKIYGRRPHKAKITLDDFIDAFPGQNQVKLCDLIQHAIRTGDEIDTELNLYNIDKGMRTVIVRAVCEKNKHNTIQGLFGIIQDVTEERRHQARLRNKEELMSMAFKATSDGIWDWDLSTNQTWYSPQWKAQLGYEDDEIANHFDSWADLIFEEDRIKALDEIEAHVAGKTDRFEMIQRFRHKTGHTVHILVRAFAIRNEKGQAVRIVGAHTDVTELKRLEQAKSEFTSIVSHELRTPLTAIHGSIGLLAGHYASELPPEINSILQVANNNSERLILLVNDILDMEKLQSGRMDFDIREICLGEFLPQAVENHISYARKFDVELDYDNLGDTLNVLGDPDRLMQVMSNLLSNAIKFSSKEDTVKIRTHSVDDKIAISVIDTGRGIPREMQDKIFDKFIQADSSDQRHKGGTGLGLAITKAMMEHMNGNVSVISKEGEGSTFTLTLPKLTPC